MAWGPSHPSSIQLVLTAIAAGQADDEALVVNLEAAVVGYPAGIDVGLLDVRQAGGHSHRILPGQPADEQPTRSGLVEGRTSQRLPVASLSTKAAGAPATSITSTRDAPCSSSQPISTGSSADIGLDTQVTDQPDGATAAMPSPAGASWTSSGSHGSGPRTSVTDLRRAAPGVAAGCTPARAGSVR